MILLRRDGMKVAISGVTAMLLIRLEQWYIYSQSTVAIYCKGYPG